MAKRQDTCTKEKCPFWIRYKDQCPNYVEGLWKTNEGDTYATADCAPKRTMILTQQLYDFMFGMRIDYANVRKSNVQVLKQLGALEGLEFIEGKVEEPKLIEEKTDGKDTD